MFPAAQGFAELHALVQELLADHAWLRESFSKAEAHSLSSTEINEFAKRLSEHIRKEERELFERLQQLMTEEERARLGQNLDGALAEAEQSCALPTKKRT